MRTIFTVASVSKGYGHGEAIIYAIQNVSLSIENGDTFGIIGLSGAGKSTLIRCLSGTVTPTSGNIIFLGRDLARMTKDELRAFRKSIGMIFQHFNLLSSRTVAANIAYPMEIVKVPKEKQESRIDDLLRLVGLSEKKNAYPSQLSGGEKQRVAIARALANSPQVLLCDEATSALDPKTTAEILALLRNINQQLGVTIVLITHEMDVIKQLCNKVAVMEKGSVVEEGLVAEVFAEPQHPTTKQFLQAGVHAIPPEFLKKFSPHRKLLRLRFKGQAAGEPIISEIVRKFHVNANILLGWIDRLQTVSIGTLVIELTGSTEGLADAFQYLAQKNVQFEVIGGHENGS